MNKLIKLSFLTLLLVFCAYEAQSQKAVVPGYQGKRFLVGINIGFAPTTRGLNSKGRRNYTSLEESLYGKTSFFAFSGNYGLELGYTVGRRMTVTASASRGKTGMVYRGEYLDLDNNRFTEKDFLYSVKYSFASLGFEVTKEKKWGIAPIGPYWGIRGLYIKAGEGTPLGTSIRVSGEYELLDIEDCNCKNIEIPLGDSKFNAQFLVGNRTILKSGVYINVGASISFLSWSLEDDDSPLKRVNALLSLNGQLSVGKLF